METLYTPFSMRSPLASIALFSPRKKRDWSFNGRAARSTRPVELGPVVYLDDPAPKKTVRVRFFPKTGFFRMLDRSVKTFEGVKFAAKCQGYTHVRLGGKIFEVN